MPWPEGTTVKEARRAIAHFLKETGCSDICANCPAYPGAGCCSNADGTACPHLQPGAGCQSPNLSCLSYVCSVLIEHLRREGSLHRFLRLTYGLPREGYRGCQRREEGEVLQVTDPLAEVAAKICISPVQKDDPYDPNYYVVEAVPDE